MYSWTERMIMKLLKSLFTRKPCDHPKPKAGDVWFEYCGRKGCHERQHALHAFYRQACEHKTENRLTEAEIEEDGPYIRLSEEFINSHPGKMAGYKCADCGMNRRYFWDERNKFNWYHC